MPKSATSPILPKLAAKRADAPATTVSQHSAIDRPAPTAAPSTAATIGRRDSTINRTSRCVTRNRSRPPATSVTFMPAISPPPEKCPPAPVTTTARTERSASSRSNASTSATRIGIPSALRRSG